MTDMGPAGSVCERESAGRRFAVTRRSIDQTVNTTTLCIAKHGSYHVVALSARPRVGIWRKRRIPQHRAKRTATLSAKAKLSKAARRPVAGAESPCGCVAVAELAVEAADEADDSALRLEGERPRRADMIDAPRRETFLKLSQFRPLACVRC